MAMPSTTAAAATMTDSAATSRKIRARSRREPQHFADASRPGVEHAGEIRARGDEHERCETENRPTSRTPSTGAAQTGRPPAPWQNRVSRAGERRRHRRLDAARLPGRAFT
jgi:hypothetical protein